MQVWARSYSIFGLDTVFAPARGQSALFTAWLSAGTITYVGHVCKSPTRKFREICNDDFRAFLTQEEPAALPDAFAERVVRPELWTGYKAFSKFGGLQPEPDRAIWALACAWTERHFLPYTSGCRVLSFVEACEELRRDASPGFPWNQRWHSKADLMAQPFFQQLCQQYWDSLHVEQRSVVPIWSCTQKVERRPLEKIEAGSLRAFTAAPVEHTVAELRLSKDFLDRLNASHDRTWSKLGRSKYYGSWHRMMSKLNRHHAHQSRGGALDISNNDGTVYGLSMYANAELTWKSLRRAERTELNHQRIMRVTYDSVHSVVVMETGELVQKHVGNPSGGIKTSANNTLSLFRYFAYAYIVLSQQHVPDATAYAALRGEEKRGSCSYESFMRDVEACMSGDDNTYTAHDEVISWFTPDAISEVWSRHLGVKATSEVPDGLALAEDLPFLSQRSKRCDSWLLPAPDRRRVLSSLMWGSESPSLYWHLLRAHALRTESWPDEYLRGLLRDYVLALMKKCPPSEGEIRGVKIKTIIALWRDDSALRRLYTGEESDGALNHQAV